MVNTAWDGKAKVATKSGSDSREERKTVTVTLTVPKNEGQTIKEATGNVWKGFGNTDQVWMDFLNTKLIPIIREALTQAIIRETSLHGSKVGDLVRDILAETVSPADVQGPTAHRLACALSPRGNWLPCSGQAHMPGVDQDHCMVCLGDGWGWVRVPVGVHTWAQYTIARERAADAVTWKDS